MQQMQPTYAHTMCIHGHTRYALVHYHCGQEYGAWNNVVASAKALIKEHVKDRWSCNHRLGSAQFLGVGVELIYLLPHCLNKLF